MRAPLPAALALVLVPAAAQEPPAGFVEAFALADDRAAVLEQLLPGSQPWYRFRVLHLQNEGRLDESAELLAAWRTRWQDEDATAIAEAENRQALLDYARDPAGTFAFLRQRLGLRFEQRREAPGEAPDLPARLDPALLAPAALRDRALALHPGTLEGFTDAGVRRLDAESLTPALRQRLLERLEFPDRDDLARLVVDDLRARRDAFGSRAIHAQLLPAQLEECARLMPELLAYGVFVTTWAARLAPGDDEDRDDPAVRDAWLARLGALADRTPAALNSFKAHVLYQRLEQDRRMGRFERQRLWDYLRLPQRTPLRNAKWLDAQQSQTFVQPGWDAGTGLPALRDDGPLLRELLLEALRGEDDWRPWAEVLDADVARRLFAESRLLAGAGDPQELLPLLGGAAEAEALRARVELAFAPTQPARFGPRDPVHLELDLKRVPSLRLRIFEIDAFNAYAASGREIDAALELDGLLANHERRVDFDDPGPLRRVRRRIELPEATRPGVYVVELVAEGLVARAVIHKGRLQHVVRAGAAGHAFRVLDDDGRPLDDAAIWLDRRLYTAGPDGEIVVPYSATQDAQSVVLVHGERASLARFTRLFERYELLAGVLLDREALLPQATARLLVRPVLRVNGRPASLALLQEPRLTLVAQDLDGHRTVQELRDLVLSADGELVHEFQVPERLASLELRLAGRVSNLSRGSDDELAAPAVVLPLASVRQTDTIASALPGLTPDGHVLDVLGLAGEPLPNWPVTLTLRLRDVHDPLELTLRSDDAGRVHLGALEGVESVRLPGFGEPAEWLLRDPGRTWPSRLAALAGETLRVPAPPGLSVPSRARISLLELRGGRPVADHFARLSVRDGFLELRDLPPGSHELRLHDELVKLPIDVTAGIDSHGWRVGAARILPPAAPPALHVTSVAAEGDDVVVRLAHAGPAARVHLVATRWLPPWDLLEGLDPGPAVDEAAPPRARSEAEYHASRALGDELRYVLERREARTYPGNMLQRPTLLLNPWELAETETGQGLAGGGGKFGRRGGAPASGGPGTLRIERGAGHHPGLRADLSFLPAPSVTLANLRPDGQGVLRVPRAQLGAGHLVQVVALDDETTATARLVLPEAPLQPRDVSLAHAFDAGRHLAESRRIEFLAAGATARVAEPANAQAEALATLGDVLRVFAALGGEAAAELPRFAFLARWPALTRDERLAALSEHGCHELHLFVHQHDPQLFDEVLRPYLRNKLHPTFLDRWLLGEDLSAFLEPQAFAQLNVMERALLAQRLPQVAAGVTRALDEVLALRAPDPDGERRRFEAALGVAALETAQGLGDAVRDMASEAKAKGFARAGAAAAPGPTEAPPAQPMDEITEAETSAGAAGRLSGRGRREADGDAELREDVRQLHRGLEPTRMYVEHNYRHRTAAEHDGDLLPANRFWADFARAPAGAPFVSPHVAEATSSLNEMLLALALTDLPFEADAPQPVADGEALLLHATAPLLLASRQVVDAPPAQGAPPVFVGQELLQPGGRAPRPAPSELRTGTVYAQRVVVTNPTPEAQRVSLLLQIPQGAVPVGRARATRGAELVLDPWKTEALSQAFYFPHAGEFPYWPAHATRDGALLATGQPAVLRVLDGPPAPDAASWEWVSQNAAEAELWAFLEGANLHALDLSRMAWRLREPASFRAALAWFGARQVCVPELWSFALLHEDSAAAREYLAQRADFVARCGPALASPLLDIDPVERHAYQHVEFEPLVNARAHPLGGRRTILDTDLAAQWARLLDVLAHRPRLDDVDRLSVTYCLLLQDRVEEALAWFARVDPARLPGRLQHDLLTCYLAFFGPDPQSVRPLAQARSEHPLPRWRERFTQVLAQLDEAAGRAPPAEAGADLAASEPALELELAGGALRLRHANLPACELRWYPMDAELLFSRDPFGAQDASAFATIRPARSETLALDAGAPVLELAVPEAFRDADVLVEARAAGLVRRVARHASALAVTFTEARGQVRVTRAEGGEPLPGAYVKVFGRDAGGQVQFHKDGYTDLRGRFDYVSVSGAGLPERFAVLVLAPGVGTVIRQVEPPAD